MTDTNRYGPTAARKQDKPGREIRPKSTTIDIHSHVGVPAAARSRSRISISTVPLAHFATDNVKALNAKQEADRRTRMTGLDNGLDERLRDMDEMGLDMQLVMPPPPQCYFTVPVEIGVKATRVLNDGIAEYVARKPDRFVALGTVPLQDGNEAATELERSMKQLGFKGCQILTNVAGKELSDPAFAPFWAKAEALGALVVIHPNGFTRRALLAALLQQRDRQSARYHGRAALPDLRRRAGAPPEPEDPRRAWRRLSRRLFGPHRSRLGRAHRRRQQSAQAADRVSQEGLLRHDRVHAAPARISGEGVRRRPHPDGHRLSVRHGGLRSGRPCGRDGVARREDRRGDLRRECEEAVGTCSRYRHANTGCSRSATRVCRPASTSRNW